MSKFLYGFFKAGFYMFLTKKLWAFPAVKVIGSLIGIALLSALAVFAIFKVARKLEDKLFPGRSKQLQNKWWHRLAQVLAVTSTLGLGFITATHNLWFFPDYEDCFSKQLSGYVYSFEPNYNKVKSHPLPVKCRTPSHHGIQLPPPYASYIRRAVEKSRVTLVIGDRYVDTRDFITDFLTRYLTFEIGKKASREHPDVPQSEIAEVARRIVRRRIERYTYEKIDKVMSELCAHGKISSIQAKPVWTIKTLPCIWFPLNCIIWFTFWWFIVYKGVILYIAFGRHAKESGPHSR